VLVALLPLVSLLLGSLDNAALPLRLEIDGAHHGIGVGTTGAVVLSPHDADFYNASLDWNQGLCRPTPAVIVFASNAIDVANAVKYAHTNGLAVTVRSGRHSYECFSVGQGSMVIDVSALRHISIQQQSPELWTVSAGPGVQLIELYAALWQHGELVFPGGSCPTVALGGFTLGGGYGFLSRQLGLGADQLLSAEVVLANGAIYHTTAGGNDMSSLVWGLQGGGNGNFGVVTNMTLRATLLPSAQRHSIVHYTVYWHVADAVTAFAAWQSLAPTTDRRLSLSFVVYENSVKALAQFLGTQAELESLLAPLLAVGKPYDTSVQVFTSYLNATLDFAGCGTLAQCLAQTHQWPASQPPLAWKAKSLYISVPLNDTAIARFVSWMLDPLKYRQCCAGQFAGFMLDPYGGAIADRAPNATAFPHRNALYHVQLMGYWNATSSADRNVTEQWLTEVYADLQALVPPPYGAYRNYPDLDLGSTFMAMYYGTENAAALEALKARYDPLNTFRYPQSVPLASAAP